MLLTPTRNDDLITWLNYLGQIHVTGIDLGLERVLPVAENLGLTQPQAKIITVAGTNGKGSTTTVIASILHQQGYQVGLYQSPHINRFNERIKICQQEIDDSSLIQALAQVESARQICQLSLSFFEATTLAAFLLFKQAKCDVWVLEIGLGGRLDVVNLISPDVAVITNVGLDHVDWLGNTIEKIAYEKAGIIREGIPVVFAGEQDIPLAILDKIEQCQSTLYAVNRDYFIQKQEQYWLYSTSGLTLKLPYGNLALINIAAAVSTVLVSGLKIETNSIEQGILKAQLAGRFEVKTIKNQTVIFDAGHNPHGIAFLKQQLQTYLAKNAQYQEIIAVFSMLADKDIQQVVNDLKADIKQWYIAPLHVPRASTQQQLLDALQGQDVQCFENIQCAFQHAITQTRPNQIILVCGSFHTLEAVLEYLSYE